MPSTQANQRYDAIIIGAGQAGVPLSRDLAAAGWRTALIERAHVGGTCYNEGCTPSKTMAASARVAYLARRAGDYGVGTGPVAVDMRVVHRRKNNLVESWRAGAERRLRATPGLDLIIGEASFSAPQVITVKQPHGESYTLEAPKIFINTGARPSLPPIAGLADVPYLDSTTIMDLETVPEHLLILGAGYIAMEFAQMFRRFGSKVTIVHRGDRVLSREDAEVADALAAILREDGITILLHTEVESVRRQEGGSIVLQLRPESSGSLEGSHLLVATGRRPNTDDLNLTAVDLQTDGGGYIPVNDRLETSVPGLWALGDVKGGPAFTHISYDDYRIVRTNLLGKGGASTAGRMVPYTVFTDPQLGRIGLSETEARKKNLDFRVATLGMDAVARALETEESRGFMKAVVDAVTGRILGAAVVGIDGGELTAIIEVAMLGGVTAETLHEATFAHPTLSEALNNLFAAG